MENILTNAQIERFQSLGFICEHPDEELDHPEVWLCSLNIPNGKVFIGLNIYTDGTDIIISCEEYKGNGKGTECTVNRFPFTEEKLIEVTKYLRSI